MQSTGSASSTRQRASTRPAACGWSGYAEIQGEDIELHDDQFVPGVKVSGILAAGRTGKLTVASSAPGTVQVKHERISGKLGGKRVRISFEIPETWTPTARSMRWRKRSRRLPRWARAKRLAQESSPYLLQHQDNPVDWYPWGEEALERLGARTSRFLSIGYSACHWCHVMEHESFENEAIAAAA